MVAHGPQIVPERERTRPELNTSVLDTAFPKGAVPGCPVATGDGHLLPVQSAPRLRVAQGGDHEHWPLPSLPPRRGAVVVRERPGALLRGLFADTTWC